MSAVQWIVGANGLLGSAVREAAAASFAPSEPIAWGTSEAGRTLDRGIAEFAERVAGAPRWQVLWCAGAGVVGTSAASLADETRTLEHFLHSLRETPPLRCTAGTFVLASSAGGVYAGVPDCPATERTEPAPISDYGRAKLAQEAALRRVACGFPLLSTLTARFSNLYGTAQRLDKPQGLISQLARASIYDEPLHVYVSLDTIRDYLFVEDAARMLLQAAKRLDAAPRPAHVARIFASERDTAIAKLIAIFRTIAKRHLKIVSGSLRSTQQPRRLSFRSEVWPDLSRWATTELVDGVHRVYRHQLALYQRGLLAPPNGERRRT